VEEVAEKGDDERLEALLCGAVKALKMSRAKPDQALYISLFYLVKSHPLLFQSEVVVEVSSLYVADCLLQARNVDFLHFRKLETRISST